MKLLNVLEVLNFFGYTADNLTSCVLLDDKFYIDTDNDNLLAKTPVSWTRYDQHYVYSAIWSNQLQSVTILMLGPRSAFSGENCRVWFKLFDTYVSKPGRFSFNIQLNVHNPNFHQYEVHCKPNDIPANAEPHGVLLGKENSLKLFKPIEVQRESHDKDNLIICIAPDYAGNPDTHLVQFIAYHLLLGVRHFVAYDIGIHYKVLNFLRSIAGHRDLFKTFTTILWQFPTVDLQLEKSVLQKDCRQRTQGHSKHSVLLSMDQYLVFNEDKQLNSLNKEVAYTFKVKKCCNNRLSKKTWPMAMKKTLCEITNETLNFNTDEQVMNNQAPQILGSVHKLEEICEKFRGKDDKTMAKYLINFVNSKLLNLWKSQLKYSIIRTNNTLINL